MPSPNSLRSVAHRRLGLVPAGHSEVGTPLRACRSFNAVAYSLFEDRDRNLKTSHLIEVNYPKLVRIAEKLLKNDRLRRTVESNELVHITYLRLGRAREQTWTTAGEFIRAFVTAMRNALIDLARARDAQKRGRNVQFIPLDQDHA